MPPPMTWRPAKRLSVVVVTYNSRAAVAGLAARAGRAARRRRRARRRRQRVARRHGRDRPARSRPGAVVVRRRAATPASPPARTRARAPRRASCCVFLNPDATPAPGFAEAIRAPRARGWAAWMGLVTADGGTGVNTSGGVVHFTGIAWAGGRRPAGSARGPREVAFAVGRLPGGAARRRGRRRAGSPAVTSCTTRTSTSRCGCGWRAGGSAWSRAAVVDHDYEFAKGAAKWRLLERNRWATIVRCYPGPLLRAARARAAGHRGRAAAGRGRRRLAAAEAAGDRRDGARAAAAAARAARDPGRPDDLRRRVRERG